MNNENWLVKSTAAGKADLSTIIKTPEANPERLYHLIADIIDQDPYELDGRKWAARPQSFYVEQLGYSVETLRRIIKLPPFVRQTREIAGRNTTLLRLGNPDVLTDKHLANTMSKIWRLKIGRPQTSKAEYGCICGLIGIWPKEHAIEIFKLVLDQWSDFMACAKFEMDELEAKGEGKAKFYKWPSLTVIRRFSNAAIEVWTTEKQAKLSW